MYLFKHNWPEVRALPFSAFTECPETGDCLSPPPSPPPAPFPLLLLWWHLLKKHFSSKLLSKSQSLKVHLEVQLPSFWLLFASLLFITVFLLETLSCQCHVDQADLELVVFSLQPPILWKYRVCAAIPNSRHFYSTNINWALRCDTLFYNLEIEKFAHNSDIFLSPHFISANTKSMANGRAPADRARRTRHFLRKVGKYDMKSYLSYMPTKHLFPLSLHTSLVTMALSAPSHFCSQSFLLSRLKLSSTSATSEFKVVTPHWWASLVSSLDYSRIFSHLTSYLLSSLLNIPGSSWDL